MSLENKALVKTNYQIEKQIGGGGSGLTYLVKDDSGKEYCMKEFRFGMKKGDENTFKARELFEREAEILQSLDHPQIPKFEDYFVKEKNNEEKLYLVMENISGKSLDKIKLTEQDAIYVAKEMTGILDYLHNHSPPIIHRDIKPQNIIQTPDNKIKLVDFGSVADKILRESKISYTRVGTFGYSAPESLYGESRPASDIYSLGATLISLLSGRDPTKMMNSKSRIEFKGKLNISKQTEKLLWDMTNPDWEKRIGNVDELRGRLEGNYLSNKIESIYRKVIKKKNFINKNLPKKVKLNYKNIIKKESKFNKECLFVTNTGLEKLFANASTLKESKRKYHSQYEWDEKNRIRGAKTFKRKAVGSFLGGKRIKSLDEMARLLYNTNIVSSIEEGRKLTPLLDGHEIEYDNWYKIEFSKVTDNQGETKYRIWAFCSDFE